MILRLINNTFRYEMQKLAMAFYPDQSITVVESDDYAAASADRPPKDIPDGETAVITVTCPEDRHTVSVSFEDRSSGTYAENTEPEGKDHDLELSAGRALYRTLSQVSGISPAWGILTGVRPSKLMTASMEKDGAEAAQEHFIRDFYVSPKKAALAALVSRSEQDILRTSTPDSFSLYVSIPFCPNRCSYCSFVSHSIASPSAKKLLPDYFDKLLIEVKQDAALAASAGLHLRSVYIGGGTPSTLSAEQIAVLLHTIKSNYDFSDCSEFTFEAGRPDTITQEKLQAIYDGGADRISINPQTMTDEILQAIGRGHTTEQILSAFQQARDVGFRNINMDLIAGLPGDSPANFDRSLRRVLRLDPESVTVHTLAYKRSSSLVPTEELFSRGRDTAAMVDTSFDLLSRNGYSPYYLYRQTRSVGNLENVGWAKPGFESRYNVYMMEECHTVFACGAGAVSKLLSPDGTAIKRVFNYKYPYEYTRRFEEIMDQKQIISDFWSGGRHE